MTRRPPSPAKLLEREVQRQVKDFLQWRGWRTIREQVAMVYAGLNTFQVGEKGMPDLLAIYYFHNGLTLTLWIETKRPGKQLRPEQEAWRQLEQKKGAVVWRIESLDQLRDLYDLQFGWIHKDDRVKGQKTLGFNDLSNLLGSATQDLHADKGR